MCGPELCLRESLSEGGGEEGDKLFFSSVRGGRLGMKGGREGQILEEKTWVQGLSAAGNADP